MSSYEISFKEILDFFPMGRKKNFMKHFKEFIKFRNGGKRNKTPLPGKEITYAYLSKLQQDLADYDFRSHLTLLLITTGALKFGETLKQLKRDHGDQADQIPVCEGYWQTIGKIFDDETLSDDEKILYYMILCLPGPFAIDRKIATTSLANYRANGKKDYEDFLKDHFIESKNPDDPFIYLAKGPEEFKKLLAEREKDDAEFEKTLEEIAGAELQENQNKEGKEDSKAASESAPAQAAEKPIDVHETSVKAEDTKVPAEEKKTPVSEQAKPTEPSKAQASAPKKGSAAAEKQPEPVKEPEPIPEVKEPEEDVFGKFISELEAEEKTEERDQKEKKTAPLIPKDVVTGVLKISNNYFNFYPLYDWHNGIPERIDSINAVYPDMGNILLYGNGEVPPSSTMLQQFGLYNIELRKSDLKQTRDQSKGRTKYYVNVQELIKQGRFVPAFNDSTDNACRRAIPVVVPANDTMDELTGGWLDVKVPHDPHNDVDIINSHSPVLLLFKDEFYGPFRLTTSANGTHRINLADAFRMPGKKNAPGIVPRYRVKDGRVPLRSMWSVPYLTQYKFAFVSDWFMQKDTVDLISDEDLISNLNKVMPDGTEVIGELRNWVRVNGKQGFSEYPHDWTAERIKRLLEISRTAMHESKEVEKAADLITALMKTQMKRGKDTFDQILAQLAQRPDVLRQLPQTKSLQVEREKLARQLSAQKHEFSAQRSEQAKAREAHALEIKKLKNELSPLYSLKNLDEEKKKIQLEIDRYKAEAKKEAEELEKVREERRQFDEQIDHFQKRLDQTVETVASLSFEGAITSKIMESAATWNQQNLEEVYRRRVSAIRSLPKTLLSGDALNKELVRRISSFRTYDPNEFINFFICASQNFLTVLAGAPGSGKTSFSDLFGRIMGLTSISGTKSVAKEWPKDKSLANRYIPVSVERGWTSKRDLIGYFNPLTRTFESTDPHRYECFYQLDSEAKEGYADLPYVMLLDEANLSPMEYYFADFMNICDQRNDLSHISLGNNIRFRIPDTLRIIATINNDHTVEQLSPRLIDRAFVVTLPDFIVGESESDKDSAGAVFEPISWEAFQKTYDIPYEPNGKEKEAIMDVAAAFAPLGIELSPRTYKAIVRYVGAASRYMTAPEGGSVFKTALDFAIDQKILTGLSGFDEEYSKELFTLKEFLEVNGYARSSKRLERILKKGKTSGLYSFF